MEIQFEQMDKLLDRVERIARDTAKPPPPEHPIIKKLRMLGVSYPTNTGIALYGPTPDANITWEEIIAYAREQ